MSGREKEISVFVDESGSFDDSASPSRYYLVCLVFHDQSADIEREITALGDALAEIGMPREHCVHAGPLVRREQDYARMSREERRRIFAAMLAFIRRADIRYRCFAVDKKFITNVDAIHDELLQQMLRFLVDNVSDLGSCDALKVYYDNGQAQVTELLREAFALFSAKTQFVTSVSPSKYRLFQAADLLCTLELTRIKLEREGRISQSEKQFFVSIQNLKKHYLKPTLRKRWA